jgi:hypothetical protein
MDIWASRTPRKQAPLNIKAGVLNIGNDPENQHSWGLQGFIRDDQLPQSAHKSKTPIRDIKDWYAYNPHLFIKRSYGHPGCDSEKALYEAVRATHHATLQLLVN